jgi:hypothetical protein
MTDSTHELDQVLGMDTKLDDIPDLPEFKALFSGSYVLILEKGIEEKTIDTKDEKEKQFFACDFIVKQIMEISEKINENDPDVPKEGNIQSMIFDRKHAIAMGVFKRDICGPIAARFGCSTIGECIEQSKGLEFLVVGRRTHDKASDRYNFQIKRSALV